MTYDQWIGALCLWRECRNCTPEVINAIWHVLMNRVQDKQNRWPKTVHGVVLQPFQFSSFNKNDPNSYKFPQENNRADWDAWEVCETVVVQDSIEDPAKGANHYEDCNQDSLPGWADPSKITVTIPPFRFYKL